jgi:hypothetical protein
MGMPGEKHLLSGDGRAGATAPTTKVIVSREAVDAFDRGEVDAVHGGVSSWRGQIAEGLAAAWPHLLAAWIDGLTPAQLNRLAHEIITDQSRTNPEAIRSVRAALTRLGGAHE